MKRLGKIELILYVLVINLMSFSAKATERGYENEVNDPPNPGFPGGDPGLPIDDWMIPMFVIGLVLVYYYYRKQYHKTMR
jgi:hypothetical protein